MAAWLRGQFERGDAQFGWSYILNVVGLFAILAGAVTEARVASLFLEFRAGPERRRAILEAVAGLTLALVGCVALGGESGGAATRVLLAILLGLGAGAGLAGLATLAWFYGLDWAGGRLERLDQVGVDERRRRLRDRP
jgi:hypothetical protein